MQYSAILGFLTASCWGFCGELVGWGAGLVGVDGWEVTIPEKLVNNVSAKIIALRFMLFLDRVKVL